MLIDLKWCFSVWNTKYRLTFQSIYIWSLLHSNFTAQFFVTLNALVHFHLCKQSVHVHLFYEAHISPRCIIRLYKSLSSASECRCSLYFFSALFFFSWQYSKPTVCLSDTSPSLPPFDVLLQFASLPLIKSWIPAHLIFFLCAAVAVFSPAALHSVKYRVCLIPSVFFPIFSNMSPFVEYIWYLCVTLFSRRRLTVQKQLSCPPPGDLHFLLRVMFLFIICHLRSRKLSPNNTHTHTHLHSVNIWQTSQSAGGRLLLDWRRTWWHFWQTERILVWSHYSVSLDCVHSPSLYLLIHSLSYFYSYRYSNTL